MNETFNIIRDNLTRAYIFYIPESLYHKIQDSPLKDIVSYSDTNTIAFMDKDRNLVVKETAINRIQIVTKNTILNKNIFHLLEAQTKLTLEQFVFILKEYREFIDIHVYVTNWMANNLNNDIINVSDVNEKLFINQSNTFKKHLDLLNRKFGSVESNFKGMQLNNKLKERFASSDFKVTVPKLLKSKVENKTSKPRKKKVAIISDNEADNFLLKSVFNINTIK